MNIRKRCAAGVVAALVVTLVAGNGYAALLQYTVSFQGTGMLGTHAFTNAQVTFLSVADTNNVGQVSTPPGYYTYVLRNNSTIVSVAGLGEARLTENTQTVSITLDGVTGSAGLASAFGIPLAASNAILLGYDLRTPVGPIAGSLLGSFTTSAHDTTAGSLRFFQSPSGAVSFAATTVPEPGLAAVLWCACAVGLCLRRRRTV